MRKLPDDKKVAVGREASTNNARAFNVDYNGPTTMLVLAEHTGFPVVLQIPLDGAVPTWSPNEQRIILQALLQEVAHIRNGGELGPPTGITLG